MDDDQQFCLRWNNHQSTLISVFDTLLENETLVDCTLAAEGKFLKAHKVVLSACSPYFATLLQEQYDKHPIFILKDVKYQELRAMMDYMYRGEVNISQDQLAALLKAAESLQIKGLSDNRTSAGNSGNTIPKIDTSSHQAQQQQQQHRNLNVPLVGKISGGYTLEQTKRQRLGPSTLDAATELSGSREGSSSPSRRRRKVRRRSIENTVMSDVHHDNSNSSQQQTNSIVGAPTSGLSGVSAITAAASALAAAQLPAGALAAAAAVAAAAAATGSSSSNVVAGSNLTANVSATSANVTKKTEGNIKSVSGVTTAPNTSSNNNNNDAMTTENLTAAGGSTIMSTDDQEHQHHLNKADKQPQQPQQHHNNNNKQQHKIGAKDTSDLVVEPKSEYDDEGNEETVEDLTLDDEDMGMDDLDHNAGTSQGGAEGSNQGYVPWQHDRSQDELLLATQEAQQRDPQDLSITRIAGLTWNEWNARLAMPLVTQLGESVQPLVFPTDLSINTSSTPPSTSTTTTQIITTITNKKKLDKNASALRESSAMNIETHASASSLSLSTATTPIKTERLADGGSGRSTPHHKSHLRGQLLMSADNDDDEDDDDDDDDNNDLDNQHPRDHHRHHGGKSVGKLKHLTEEEATALMLKAVAEKGSSGNLSDNSYSEENSVVAAAAATAAAFADAGLCNINILNSISAMNSLIGANNGALSLTSSSAASGVTGTGNNNVGSTNNNSGNNIAMMSGIGGHPCPECGRVYKLKSSLRNHQKWECGKEPQFQCPFCVYRAKQKMHIGRHMERMHKEKFVKLDDLKSYSSAAGSSGGVSHSGGIAGDNTGTGSRHTSGHDDPVSDLRQHFS